MARHSAAPKGSSALSKARFGMGINPKQYHPTIARLPREFQAISSLGQIDKMGWAKLATYYYDVTQFRFPLTPAEFEANFQGIRRVFSLLDPQAQEGRQTNTAVGSGVNEIFVAVGAGIVAMGEDVNTTFSGIAMDRPAATQCTPLVPDLCVTRNRAVAGDLGVGARDATLWFGGPTWRFIDKMFNHYRLQIYANRRFQMVDESLFDVGMVPAPPEFIGASDSNVPMLPFIREVNDVMSDKDINKIFLQFATNGPGSGCGGPDIAPATWGHPRIAGLANRLYCFNTPLVMLPGMQFDVELVPVENDICNLNDMEAASVLDTATPTTQDAILTENFCNATGQNDGFASQYTIQGGCLHIGVVLKGFSLQPQACIEYLLDYVSGGGRSALAEIYGNMLQGLPEAAVVRHLLEQERDQRQVPQQLSGIRQELGGRLAGIVQKAAQQSSP
jgi:hypothetical protein